MTNNLNIENEIKKDDILTLKVKRLGINGEGIAYFKRLAVFIDGAIPGETVRASVVDVFHNRITAKVDKVINRSSKRIDPFCPVYDLCGGCQTQHVLYDYSLELKRDLILKANLKYLGRDYGNLIDETIGSKDILGYRNKASLPVRYIDGRNRFGMYERNSNNFIPVKDCGVQRPVITNIFKSLMDILEEHNIKVYDSNTKEGDLHSLVVRESEHSGEIQVTYVLLSKPWWLDEVTSGLVKLYHNIKSVYLTINNNINNQVLNLRENNLIYGNPVITEELEDLEYHLTNETYFPLNTPQTAKFYEVMISLANLDRADLVVDAYSGLGLITRSLHNKVSKVYALEARKRYAQLLIDDLEARDVDNVLVINENMRDGLAKINNKIDVMFFDLPRGGIDDNSLKAVLAAEPRKIVYGSSNPSTLAKNLKVLLNKYNLIKTVPVDFFPQTSLVESITLLELKITS